jgi:CIC family chloride channel protein
VAAGISAVFRTPLGAALLAVEVLYRDGFESDALVPSIFASVIAYSIVISIFGETTLFAHAPRFEFVPWHLGFYALLALLLAALAAGFSATLQSSKRLFARLPVPTWLTPAIGGLALGALSTTAIVLVGSKVETSGQGLGILGGGYGAIQTAISGASWLPAGWSAVQLLLFLSLLKLVAASLTIGSGGSAGDFAPSLAIGGLFGGAFGRAVQLLVDDPRLDPGAFTLVGMGVFYGGIAHVPLSALVLVCELAGNYDLLVPLMLSQGIAFVALRKRALYEAQLPTQSHSPVHANSRLHDALRSVRVADVMMHEQNIVTFQPQASISEMRERVGESTWQEVFPVIDAGSVLVGLVSADAMRLLVADRAEQSWACAADLMQAPLCVELHDNLRTATELLLANGLREIPVVNAERSVIGFLDERDVARVYLESESQSRDSTVTPLSAGRR